MNPNNGSENSTPVPVVVSPELNSVEQPQPKLNIFNAGLKWYEYLICGLPFIIIFAGGAIGAAIGFFAFSTNVKIWKSTENIALKIALIIGTTAGGFILYFACVLIFNILFGEK